MILLFHVIISWKANRLYLEKSNNYCLCIISIHIDITETRVSGKEIEKLVINVIKVRKRNKKITSEKYLFKIFV